MKSEKLKYVILEKNYIQLEEKTINCLLKNEMNDYTLIYLLLSNYEGKNINLYDKTIHNTIVNLIFGIKSNNENIYINVIEGDDIASYIVNTESDLLKKIEDYYAWTGKYAVIYKNETTNKAIFDIDGKMLQLLVKSTHVKELEEKISMWADQMTQESFLNADT
jgi:hypothetical protein